MGVWSLGAWEPGSLGEGSLAGAPCAGAAAGVDRGGVGGVVWAGGCTGGVLNFPPGEVLPSSLRFSSTKTFFH